MGVGVEGSSNPPALTMRLLLMQASFYPLAPASLGYSAGTCVLVTSSREARQIGYSRSNGRGPSFATRRLLCSRSQLSCRASVRHVGRAAMP